MAFSAVHVLNLTNQPTRLTLRYDAAMSLSAQGKLGSYCIICSACGAAQGCAFLSKGIYALQYTFRIATLRIHVAFVVASNNLTFSFSVV